MTLDDLIAHTRNESPTDDPLDLIATAARQQRRLTDLGEELVGHWVAHAQTAGCSWARIGSALGVSKQAVQQRHGKTDGVLGRLRTAVASATEGLFTRFTAGARHAVIAAEEEARELRHRHLGTEHLLLGLHADPDGTAAAALNAHGATAARLRDEVVDVVGRCRRGPRGHLPFTPRAKRALEGSLRVATALGQDHIGSGHVLLGLLGENGGVAEQVLVRLGVDLDTLRRDVHRSVADRT